MLDNFWDYNIIIIISQALSRVSFNNFDNDLLIKVLDITSKNNPINPPQLITTKYEARQRAVYTIPSVSSDDAGYYQCIVVDEAGVSIYSDVIYINVVDNCEHLILNLAGGMSARTLATLSLNHI